MKLKWKRIVWLLIRSNYFRFLLLEVLKYAIKNYDKVRGDGACDVLSFDKVYFRQIIDFREK